MNNKFKMNRLDLILLIGVFIISLLGSLFDGFMWRAVEYGGFPVISMLSICISNVFYFILLIFSFFKSKKI